MGEQSDQSAFFPVVGYEPVKVHIKHRIGVKKQEILCQLRAQFKQRTSVSQGFLLKIIGDTHAEGLSCYRGTLGAISKVVHNNMPKMPHGHNNIGKPLTAQAFQLMLQHGFSMDFDHWLGNVAGDRGNASSSAACHNYCFHKGVSSVGMYSSGE